MHVHTKLSQLNWFIVFMFEIPVCSPSATATQLMNNGDFFCLISSQHVSFWAFKKHSFIWLTQDLHTLVIQQEAIVPLSIHRYFFSCIKIWYTWTNLNVLMTYIISVGEHYLFKCSGRGVRGSLRPKLIFCFPYPIGCFIRNLRLSVPYRNFAQL